MTTTTEATPARESGYSSGAEEAVRATLTAAIADISEQPAVANFVVRGPEFLSGAPTSIDFEADVADQVIADVLAFARNLSERELLPYDPSYQLSSGQALVDGLGETPELERIEQLVRGSSVGLDRAGDGAEAVSALVHRLDGPDGGTVTAYRLSGPGIAVKRDRGIRILVPRDGVWVRIPDEVLYYQPRFDVLVVGDAVIVTASTTLQRRLGSDSRAKRMARETFKTATLGIDIEGRTDLAEAVESDPAMIAKMAQLSRTLEADPEYAAFLTTARILEFLDENPQIPIATAGEGQARHLVFESSPQKRYLIPKTLADDFLRSELTNRRYEAGSKHRIDG